jgi:PAS domain S-box-containing protein
MKVPVQGAAIAGINMPRNDFASMNNDNQLIDLLPMMAWTATPEGKVNFVNLQWCAFTGLTRERLLADGMIAIVHPDDLGIRREILHKLAGMTAFE